ncbi:ShlB/FhaC/HecB family hemolysin secretion/activation protein [Burkholderia sp. AU28942]|uniref:ShlB/FhaC/HecB family hemolysin secretion/activation protein n=1 Tax=Burkholderia TaxID=32008 RepID=UPI000841C952|nr:MULTISPECIES: ShlB/FhaC/HecB family hemolysin secretion/activation protein [Burkholderia]AOK07918.1 peptide ABC transporter permease [Burkholderia latens]MCA8312549.1 ShlB/FhaC/HecB family hemolysin secretion/activation protein [Burkholderia sp. AU28942]
MKNRETSAAWISALASVSALAQGIPPSEITPGPQIQRLQQQQLEAAKELNPRPNVLTPTGEKPSAANIKHLPSDTPCFPIREIALEDNPFDWLATVLQPVVGQCVGKTALKHIQDVANNALIARGHVTSRVLVPTQSLQSGTLALRVVPGRISDLRADRPTIGWMRTALPTSRGALLNQRDIDQGLENLRRLQSQSDATFDIAPGPTPGDSELVLHPGTGKRWHAVIGADNAGMDTTGKYQLSGSFTFDSPLHLYDQLQIAGTTNANVGASDKGNQSVSANYSVPVGYALLTLGASRARYKQTVAGFDAPIEYTGVQSQLQAGLSGVVYRNAHARTELHGNLFHKIGRNAIDGVDIPVQHRDIVGYELGVSHRQYLGDAVVDGSFAWRASLPGLSSNTGTVVGSPDFDGKTRVEVASVNARLPFRIGVQTFSYQFGWNMQNARTPLTPSDYFTIGTRYAVRGFDQQLTLAAESGWAVSNELDWYVPTPIGTQALYAGIDAGRVRGAAAQYLLGGTLVGAVVGVRGNLAPKNVLGAALSYEVSLGFPVSKPQGFKTGSPTLLFQASTLF